MKNTTLERATVDQQLREIVPAEPVRRRVHLFTPPSPLVFAGIDKQPVEVGFNDGSFKLPQLPVNLPVIFNLLPGQNVIACAVIGFAAVGILVEYLD